MSRSKNSRKGSKHIRGCRGCSQCWHNRPERQTKSVEPQDYPNYWRGRSWLKEAAEAAANEQHWLCYKDLESQEYEEEHGDR